MLLKIILLTVLQFSNFSFAQDFAETGKKVLASNLANISPTEKKSETPSIDLIFVNTQDAWNYATCLPSPDLVVREHDRLAQLGILSNINYSKDRTLESVARENLVGFLVCIDRSINLSANSSAESLSKIRKAITKVNIVNAGFSVDANKDHSRFYEDLAWRLTIDILYLKSQSLTYTDKPFFNVTMTLNAIEMHLNSEEYKAERDWLQRIYVGATLGYLDLLPLTRGFDKQILRIHLSRALNFANSIKDYDAQKKLLLLSKKHDLLNQKELAEKASEIYFNQNPLGSNWSSLFDRIGYFLGNRTLSSSLFYFILSLLLGSVVLIMEARSLGRRAQLRDVLFHPILFYMSEGWSTFFKFSHAVMIFFLASTIYEWVQSISEKILSNSEWIGFF